ncbi:hypothetical protein [Pseudomonas tussilaginis]|uniref:hypothetical protein n=1 Tax=Pseudomonas sp. 5 TaxID=1619949 RepID=UPI0005EBB10E|nr:hypothetical protein [Pseudomonas sp. 5]KJK09307.1 hypothetical protein UB47_01840 [Pseudomonas sp. 5]
MATITFDDGEDPIVCARAISTVLALWLKEQPRPEQAPPASVKFAYSDSGDLKSVTVSLEG